MATCLLLPFSVMTDVSLIVFQVFENGAVMTYYQCLRCYQLHTTVDRMAAHMRVTSKGQLSCCIFCPDGRKIRGQTAEVVLCSQRDSERYLCNRCGITCDYLTVLKLHLKHIHREDGEPFACQFCESSFATIFGLRAHMQVHDVNRRRSHVCEVCGKAYLHSSGLKQHRNTQHLHSKQFPCHICQKIFLVKHVRDQHVKVHSRAFTYSSCSQCSQVFTTAYNLRVHQRIHSGEKPYKCSVCEAAFAQKNSLNVHMRNHGFEIKGSRKQVNFDGTVS